MSAKWVTYHINAVAGTKLTVSTPDNSGDFYVAWREANGSVGCNAGSISSGATELFGVGAGVRTLTDLRIRNLGAEGLVTVRLVMNGANIQAMIATVPTGNWFQFSETHGWWLGAGVQPE